MGKSQVLQALPGVTCDVRTSAVHALWLNASMTAAAYLMGRPLRQLDPGRNAEDSLFASQRVDGCTIDGQTYQHCTFANISFKDAHLQNATFMDCAFLSCYFRGTRLTSSRFSGCKFIDCDLEKVDVRTCDFKFYNSFANCMIKYHELEHSLPQEGNLRGHLCAGLATEARKLGALRDEGLFRQAAARGHESHLKAAWSHGSEFYRQKYSGMARLEALGSYVASRFRGYLWGYRRSFLVVLRNWLLMTLVAFPILFFLDRDSGLRRPGGAAASIPDVWLASVGNILPGSGISKIEFTSSVTVALAFIEVLIGLLLSGLVAALLFRAIFDRWR